MDPFIVSSVGFVRFFEYAALRDSIGIISEASNTIANMGSNL
jgi:hypothetical protein